MTLFAKCPRCDSPLHEGPCFFENREKAAAHDDALAQRAEIERLTLALAASEAATYRRAAAIARQHQEGETNQYALMATRTAQKIERAILAEISDGQ